MPKKDNKFYIFYDNNDFVKFCGTSQELVERGYFKDVCSVRTVVGHIRQGVRAGTVAIIEINDENEKEEKYTIVCTERKR